MRTFVVFILVIAGLLLLNSPASSDQGQMVDCPLANKWSIATWDGQDNTVIDEAISTCGVGAVAAAYWLHPESQAWYRYIAGRPDITNLIMVNHSQGMLALGSADSTTKPIQTPIKALEATILEECGPANEGNPTYDECVVYWMATYVLFNSFPDASIGWVYCAATALSKQYTPEEFPMVDPETAMGWVVEICGDPF